MKQSLVRSKQEVAKEKGISFTPDISQIESDETARFNTPLKQNHAVQEIKTQSSALKSLKVSVECIMLDNVMLLVHTPFRILY